MLVSDLLEVFNTRYHAALKDSDSKATVFFGVLKNYPHLEEIKGLAITELYPSTPVGSNTPTLTIMIQGVGAI